MPSLSLKRGKGLLFLSVGLVSIAVACRFYYWGGQPTTEQIAAGRDLFSHQWTVNDPLSNGGDGLGPVFNETSCVACHWVGGIGGSGDNESNVLTFEANPTEDRPNLVSHVIHKSAIHPSFQESRETAERAFPPVEGGIRISNPTNGTEETVPFSVISYSSINSPALFGTGLIDEITDFQLIKVGMNRLVCMTKDSFAGTNQHNANGRLRSLALGRVGKFGWRSQFTSLDEFIASACAMELGLTNSENAQPIPKKHRADPNAKRDMTNRQIAELVAFVRSLPRPQQVMPSDPGLIEEIVEGEEFFCKALCNECHVRDIGNVTGIYSDFKLYELDQIAPNISLSVSYGSHGTVAGRPSDSVLLRPDDVPKLSEWKTPPLWGVADSAPYFHDGNAATLSEAILRHNGDGRTSKKLYQKLGRKRQRKIIKFLESLRAPQEIEHLKNADPDSSEMDFASFPGSLTIRRK